LILSGAIGNLIDRAVFGFVIDFINLHYQDFYWPVFNVADIAITLGVMLLLLVDLKQEKSKS
jgi:signal peptidase II